MIAGFSRPAFSITRPMTATPRSPSAPRSLAPRPAPAERVRPRQPCVLVVEVVGRQRLAAALDEREAARAVERCLHRIERAIDAHGGTRRAHDDDRLRVVFPGADAAVLAANEMLERVSTLPPLRGLRMVVRIGIHPSPARAAPGDGAGSEPAAQLSAAARYNQALISHSARALLSPAVRALLARTTPPAPAGFPEAVHVLGERDAVPPRRARGLRIRHPQGEILVGAERPALHLGRDAGNDVVIHDPRASRRHVRIERRAEGFILIDRSTNGTFVLDAAGEEHCVRHAELALTGPGYIGCGFSRRDAANGLVYFEPV